MSKERIYERTSHRRQEVNQHEINVSKNIASNKHRALCAQSPPEQFHVTSVLLFSFCILTQNRSEHHPIRKKIYQSMNVVHSVALQSSRAYASVQQTFTLRLTHTALDTYTINLNALWHTVASLFTQIGGKQLTPPFLFDESTTPRHRTNKSLIQTNTHFIAIVSICVRKPSSIGSATNVHRIHTNTNKINQTRELKNASYFLQSFSSFVFPSYSWPL